MNFEYLVDIDDNPNRVQISGPARGQNARGRGSGQGRARGRGRARGNGHASGSQRGAHCKMQSQQRASVHHASRGLTSNLFSPQLHGSACSSSFSRGAINHCTLRGLTPNRTPMQQNHTRGWSSSCPRNARGPIAHKMPAASKPDTNSFQQRRDTGQSSNFPRHSPLNSQRDKIVHKMPGAFKSDLNSFQQRRDTDQSSNFPRDCPFNSQRDSIVHKMPGAFKPDPNSFQQRQDTGQSSNFPRDSPLNSQGDTIVHKMPGAFKSDLNSFQQRRDTGQPSNFPRDDPFYSQRDPIVHKMPGASKPDANLFQQRGDSTQQNFQNRGELDVTNSEKKKNNFGFGFLHLKELSEKEPLDILMTFNMQSNKMNNSLKNNMKGDIIVLFVKCIAKFCDVDFNDNKLNLLIKICQSPFITTLEQYFLNLPYVKIVDKRHNMLFWDNIEDFLDDVFKFYITVIDLSQTTAVDTLRKIIDINKMCLQGLQEHHLERFSEKCMNMFEEIQIKIAIAMENVDKKKEDKKPESYRKFDHLIAPPNDFKEVAILPSVSELNSNRDLFIRPNITEGAYESVDHYLDVQFRLMREDFIAPMRESIMEFIEDPNKRKYNGGRFYRQTKFKHHVVSSNCIGLSVDFGRQLRKKNPKIFYRRFLFGSLLCFSDDDFTTLFFGTVVERSEALFAKGKVVVDLIDKEVDSSIFNKSFTMFESDVFYPQYGPVLEVLKTYGDTFPMKKYIVDLQESADFPAHSGYGEFYLIDGIPVYLKEEDTWPSCEELMLDEYQYRAFKMALTREFVTIQGPPGTGKTFIGLKIVKTLLNNLERKNLPILIMCYTNHALDQFLEGLITETKKIIRIGGQSKNEKLANEYNLNALRRNCSIRNEYRQDLFHDVKVIKNLQKKIENVDDEGNITDIILFDDFLPQFNIRKRLSSCNASNSRSSLVNWLMMADRPHEVLRYNTSNLLEKYGDLFDEDMENITDDVENPFENLFDDFMDVDIDMYEEFSVNTLIKDIRACDRYMKNVERADPQVLQKLGNKLHSNLLELAYLEDCVGSEHMAHNVNYLHETFFVQSNNIDIKSLDKNERWSLYKFWNEQLKTVLLEQMAEHEEEFRTTLRLYKEADLMRDSFILKDADIIGVTTTAAARLRPVLRALTPSVVVVEEAAEVLESHIVVNLTEKCQHVILIGDHQQLRPSTASYRMGVRYKLDVSLFERMYQNNKNCCQLAVQHRMRPEISRLITPAIYPLLHDHSSVHEYPNVKGVMKNLYFIDHNSPEAEDKDLTSKKNIFEAEFVLSLARYLIQQGYDPEDITILVTYSGQLFCMRELKKSFDSVNGVKICVLDNFQGEENKIILLSLVRSNLVGNIGFLKTANRVCVALSRAREGFYIVGNMDALSTASELWQSVKTTLVEQNSFGSFLPLKCQRHGIITKIQSSEDFRKVAEGGCQNLCEMLLPCAHNCQSICHVDYDGHKSYFCKQRCNRQCDLGHECPLLCAQSCKCIVIVEKILKCGHTSSLPCYLDPSKASCKVIVNIVLPLCSHEVSVKCCESKGRILCQTKCIDRLPCGHACRRNCHKDDDPEHLNYECLEKCALKNKGCTEDHICNKRCHENCELCTFKVRKKRNNCKHSSMVPCHKDINTDNCTEKCSRTMECGHHCKKKCYEPCTGCKIMVKKKKSCGHFVDVECSMDPENSQCYNRCELMLECGHRCRDTCGSPCGIKECTEKIKSPFESVCGHAFDIPCFKRKLEKTIGKLLVMEDCNKKCDMILKNCGHPCSGVCGDCRGRLHIPCSSTCGNNLVCSHICKDPCREACGMCTENCNVKCQHSVCPRLCGVPCSPCMMPCSRECEHKKCTAKCSDMCNSSPCSEACKKTLSCGHNCRGLCGEICPQICKVCKPEEFPELLFGDEDDDDARFVQLMDCRHAVEVNGLDKWVEVKTDEAISPPKCPYCKTVIVNTARYSDQVKTVLKDIESIKNRLSGNKEDKITRLSTLIEDIDEIESKDNCNRLESVGDWKKIISDIKKQDNVKTFTKQLVNIKQGKKELNLSLTNIKCFQFKIHVLKRLMKIFEGREELIEDEIINHQLEFILKALMQCDKNISEDQCDNFDKEINRTKCIIKVLSLKKVCQENINNQPLLFLSSIFSSLLNQNSTDLSPTLTILENELIYTIKPFSNEEVFDQKINILQEKCTTALRIVFEDEKKMIVKAMGFRQGHWFKCKNGHPYTIGECGGAMQNSTCPECGEIIGGANHALAAGNSLASEMDNATHAAYSEAATDAFLIRNNLI